MIGISYTIYEDYVNQSVNIIPIVLTNSIPGTLTSLVRARDYRVRARA